MQVLMEKGETIFEFRERVVQEWRAHDPGLDDMDGYREYFNQRFHDREIDDEKRFEKKIDLLVTELMRPVMVYPSPWRENNPEWLLKNIKLDRMAQLMRGVKEEATDSECVYYMMPRTLEAPMDHSWAQVFLWVCKQVLGDRVPKSEKWMSELKLDEWQERLLKDLKRWIYRQSVKNMKKSR